jgi:hypothetical protein
MQQGIKARLSYANGIGTVAVLVAVAGSALAVRNLVSGNSATNSAGSTWFIGGNSNITGGHPRHSFGRAQPGCARLAFHKE